MELGKRETVMRAVFSKCACGKAFSFSFSLVIAVVVGLVFHSVAIE